MSDGLEQVREGIRQALARNDAAAAAALARAALEQYPDSPDLLYRYGNALYLLGRHADAAAALRRALAVGADDPRIANTLAYALAGLGRHEEAAALLRQVLAARPHAVLFRQLAEILQTLRRVGEAAEALQRAAVLEPHEASTLVGLANLRMIQGDLPGAFQAYRRRLDQPAFPWRHRALPAPLWDGRPLEGRRLLVHAERDFGDTIQFLQFVPQAAERGGRVVLEVQSAMTRLAATVAGVAQVVAHGEPLPPVDCHVPLPDLPAVLGVTAGTLPQRFPYLVAPARRCLAPAPPGELRLGVVWSGRRGDGDRDIRHCRPADLAPFGRIPGVRLISLQMGPASAELGELAARCRVVDASPLIGDFADTAALLMEVDALVTIDTAIAHLGGALARPVFLLHHATPAVRWHFHALHRPWYPTLTLVPPASGETWATQAARLAELLPVLLQGPLPPVLPITARLARSAEASPP